MPIVVSESARRGYGYTEWDSRDPLTSLKYTPYHKIVGGYSRPFPPGAQLCPAFAIGLEEITCSLSGSVQSSLAFVIRR